ncbi:MAG: hypothetical protein LBH73_07440, partial [Spirochaetaceae bacterium]|nr:hypothetical protein [Spirochaetaceae bacterium]
KLSAGFKPHNEENSGSRTPAKKTETPENALPGLSRDEQEQSAKIAQARVKGYEGDPCPACGSFTMVSNGTCIKCDTCGGTTGCS